MSDSLVILMELEAQQTRLDADYRVEPRIEIRPTAEYLNANLNFLGGVGAAGETLFHHES